MYHYKLILLLGRHHMRLLWGSGLLIPCRNTTTQTLTPDHTVRSHVIRYDLYRWQLSQPMFKKYLETSESSLSAATCCSTFRDGNHYRTSPCQASMVVLASAAQEPGN